MTIESLTGLTNRATKNLGNGLHADAAALIDPTGQMVDPSDTRAYNFEAGTRTAVGVASSVEVPLGQLGPTREIMLMASTRCHIRFGAAGLAPAVAGAGVLPLAVDERFHLRVPVGMTHLRVIRDSADGFLTVIPVL